MEDLVGLPSEDSLEENEIELESMGDDEGIKETKKYFIYSNRKKLLLTVAAISIAFICIISVIIPSLVVVYRSDSKESTYPQGQNLGLVIDLGSSGSRISVFGWDENHVVQPFPYPEEGDHFYYAFRNIGIAKFDNITQALEVVMVPLLDYGTNAVEVSGVSIKQNTKKL